MASAAASELAASELAASELAANKFAATRLGLEPESPQLSNAVNIYFAVPPQGGGKECRVSRIIYNKIQSDGRKVRPIFLPGGRRYVRLCRLYGQAWHGKYQFFLKKLLTSFKKNGIITKLKFGEVA